MKIFIFSTQLSQPLYQAIGFNLQFPILDAAKYNNDLACFYRIVRQDNQPDKPIKIEVI